MVNMQKGVFDQSAGGQVVGAHHHIERAGYAFREYLLGRNWAGRNGIVKLVYVYTVEWV